MRLDCGCRKALSFDNVFIKPKRSALPSRDFELERHFKFRSGNEWSGVPLIAANMDHTGTIAMAEALSKFGCMTALHKFYNKSQLAEAFNTQGIKYNGWVSIGMNAMDTLVENLSIFDNKTNPKICIDVANGYTQAFVEYVSAVRKRFPEALIMAGNVATYEQTQQLIISGADIVKVGIGPGSVCTTRRITGVGVPQVSAIDECADAAHGMGGMVCADGGCRYPGDIAKALAVGADFVMLGGMLAGHDECDGMYVFPDGSEYESIEEYREYEKAKADSFMPSINSPVRDFSKWLTDLVEPTGMRFHGMSSREAQEQHHGGLREYRAAEGKEVVVPYRGPVKDTILEILGGLRSTMTYIGAQRLKDIPKCATLVLTHEQLNGSFS